MLVSDLKKKFVVHVRKIDNDKKDLSKLSRWVGVGNMLVMSIDNALVFDSIRAAHKAIKKFKKRDEDVLIAMSLFYIIKTQHPNFLSIADETFKELRKTARYIEKNR